MNRYLNTKTVNQDKSEYEQRLMDFELYTLELELENKVIADIRKRQGMIPGLKLDNFGHTAIWGKGEMTPGCKGCCLEGRWTQIRTTTRCNCHCSFCYYFTEKKFWGLEMIPRDMYLINNTLYRENDVKLLFENQGKKFLNGVAWLHFEPLLEIDKILSLMKFIHRKGYHQWLYTNGVLATEENLKKLADAGLEEIRFNLAATDCADHVIKNMKKARQHFKYLCIESPMFTAFYKSFMKKKNMILDTGVDHIHFAELQLFNRTREHFRSEGPMYRYRKGYVSPIKSRQLIYNIFEIAAQEKWQNIVLHDCSNETKFFRGIKHMAQTGSGFGFVAYRGLLNLDKKFYKEAMQYLKISDHLKKIHYKKLLSKSDTDFADPALFYSRYLKTN